MLPSILPLLAFIGTTSGSHIVFFHSFGTKSHLIQMTPLVEELLERNHQVTSVIYQSIPVIHPNYTQILLNNTSMFIENFYAERGRKALSKTGASMLSPTFLLWFFNKMESGIEIMAEEIFKLELVESGEDVKVDAIVCHHSLSCGLLAEVFNCPMIIFNPAGVGGYNLQGTGNVPNYSIQPYSVAPFIEPLTFIERVQNHLLHKIFDAMVYWLSQRFEHHGKKYLGGQLRPMEEIVEDRVSVVLACSHFMTHGPAPYLPNVVHVGGLQLREAKQLPTQLKHFMDAATNGVIFVSFGSAIRSDKMPADKLVMFLECFTRLEEEGVNVIWKWDKPIANVSSNVKLVSWAPQQDLLGHPNLKVFVTHGGLGSLVEAIYHKAIIVGVPFVNDQKPNIARAVKRGYALSLNWDGLNTEDMVTYIKKAIKDEDMKTKMEETHRLYVDRETSPRDTAAWWVEYVVRHGGAQFLKNGAQHVPWYQYHHVDVVVFLLFILIVCLLITALSCRCMYRYFGGKQISFKIISYLGLIFRSHKEHVE